MALSIVHVEANHGDQTRTIPLATWAATGRRAVVIASWQGAAHGSGDMGATPAPFTQLLRQPRPATYQPAMLVWTALIPPGTANVNLPINHGGCGFCLWVLADAGTVTVTDDGGGASGTSYTVSGAGDDLTLAGVSTNSTVTVSQTGGLTLTAPPPYYSETVGGHALPGVNGSFTFSDQLWAGVTVDVAEQAVTYQWSNVKPDTIVTGSQAGTGLGTDVNSTDSNGITAPASTVLEVVDKWSVNPSGPTSIGSYQARAVLPGDYTPSTEGYAISYQIEDGGGIVRKAEATLPPQTGTDAGLIPGETRIFSTGPLSGLSNLGANPQIRVKMTPTPVATLRPPGGGATIYGTWFNVDVPDWWEFSATNDRFKIRERANGPVEYAHTGGSGNGTSGSPWSPTQLRDRINSRSFPANAVVNLAAGNYIGLAGSQQFTGGGSGSTGWVTLLGPANPATPATIEGDTYRGWSMAAGSSRIQFVRLHAKNTAINSGFLSYADGGGNPYSSDATPYGKNAGAVGFQLDGFNTPRPGPAVYVNCVAEGWGEGFGGYRAGHMFGVGCVAIESAYASPNGRSGCSLSWSGGGSAAYTGGGVTLFQTNSGSNVFGGWFGCIWARSFQLVASLALPGSPNKLTDGNGMISPTDDPNATGYILNQCNIAFANSGAGVTGYNWHAAGGKVINATSFGNGANQLHHAGQTSPFYRPGTSNPLPTNISGQAIDGVGPAILMQRYVTARTTATISGCVALGSTYDSSSMTFWGQGINAAGRGNITTSSPIVASSATGSVGVTIATAANVIVNPSVSGDTSQADAHLKPGSPAYGAAYLSDVDIGFDFAGRAWVERSSGRIDAGAIQL